MQDTPDALIRELEEDERHEQWRRLWQRYGGLAIALAIAVIVAVGAYKAWEYYMLQQRYAAGDRYADALAALDREDYAEAVSKLDAVIAAGGGYAALAALRKAAALHESGATAADVAAAYEALRDDAGADAVWRELARVQLLQQTLTDDGPAPPAPKEERKEGVSAAFAPAAMELAALRYLRRGETEKARAMFERILAMPEAPDSLRDRVRHTVELMVSYPSAAPAPQPQPSS